MRGPDTGADRIRAQGGPRGKEHWATTRSGGVEERLAILFAAYFPAVATTVITQSMLSIKKLS
jgi:hypothetical protein